MILLSSIIKQFEGRFLARYRNSALPSHKKALQAMAQCRKDHGPHMLAQCTNHNCGKQIYIPHSCGHRNCPHCRNHESRQWIENQLKKRLPATYYLITFTLPAQLRDLAWKNQTTIYSLIFACVQDLLKTAPAWITSRRGGAGFAQLVRRLLKARKEAV